MQISLCKILPVNNCSVDTPLQCTTAPRVDTIYDNTLYYNNGAWVCMYGSRHNAQASKGRGAPRKSAISTPTDAKVSIHLVAILAIRGAPPLVLRLERVRTKPRLVGEPHPLRCENASHHRVVSRLGALVPLLLVDGVLPAYALGTRVRGCTWDANTGVAPLRLSACGGRRCGSQ